MCDTSTSNVFFFCLGYMEEFLVSLVQCEIMRLGSSRISYVEWIVFGFICFVMFLR